MGYKQDKYTRSARGRPCQIRIPGSCEPGPQNENVVPCHDNGAGMAMKASNIQIAYGCRACHDVVDGRAKTEHAPALIRIWFLEGILRTQEIMIKEGILKL